ncbi:aromatic ring-hydroxylating oxygenase subunit alpha [Govanella unica]|uniref:Rieske 2Fe-2S domain-containing protein n=1 Tax=Govanella unica TaxID=2975056 RepID=A0A9X3Z6S7_9PROT|nr:Rieske 2Fe-2S domain-containing protein [Govania unica]MDA5193500.1 Rieske 2Fe-2S domain-containing protein [Govania unica]
MSYDIAHIKSLVEPNRVHRDVYVDPEIFELELKRIWGRAWIYAGHESQIKNPGDTYALTIGREPIVMARAKDGSLHVLYNRCAHKGAKVASEGCGHSAGFRCPYHGWTYHHDGRLQALPARAGYADTGLDLENPAFHMQPVAQFESYRGFIFVCFDKSAPDLKTFLGDVAATLDNMADRSPEGEVEVAGPPLRYMHDNNWKMFIENLNDAMHPMIAHGSVGSATRRLAAKMPEGATPSAEAEIIFPFGSSYQFFDDLGVTGLPNGHGYMGGKKSIHTSYSDIPGYYDSMVASYGEEKTQEILSQNRHNSIFYPSFTAKDAVQAVRVVRPIAVNKTIVETWHFRLKGAPEDMLKRTILYSRLINSNASMVGPDDWDCYARMQEALPSHSTPWVDMRRGFGKDVTEGDHRTSFGTSDLSFRNQYHAWLDYMTRETVA